MQLLTQALLRKIPPINSQENEADPVCVAKFFMPDGAFTWFVIEGSTREREGCGWGENCSNRSTSSACHPAFPTVSSTHLNGGP